MRHHLGTSRCRRGEASIPSSPGIAGQRYLAFTNRPVARSPLCCLGSFVAAMTYPSVFLGVEWVIANIIVSAARDGHHRGSHNEETRRVRRAVHKTKHYREVPGCAAGRTARAIPSAPRRVRRQTTYVATNRVGSGSAASCSGPARGREGRRCPDRGHSPGMGPHAAAQTWPQATDFTEINEACVEQGHSVATRSCCSSTRPERVYRKPRNCEWATCRSGAAMAATHSSPCTERVERYANAHCGRKSNAS